MLKRHRRIEKSRTPLESIISKTPIDERLRRNALIEGTLLALPLVVSFVFYINIIFRAAQPAQTAQLSPGDNLQALVFFVFVFIIVYSIFLIFEYGNLKRKLESKKIRKIHRKKAHSRK